MNSLDAYLGKVCLQASPADNEKYLLDMLERIKQEILEKSESKKDLLLFLRKLEVILSSFLCSNQFEIGFSGLVNLLKPCVLLHDSNEFPIKKFYHFIKIILNSSNQLYIQPLFASLSNMYC